VFSGEIGIQLISGLADGFHKPGKLESDTISGLPLQPIPKMETVGSLVWNALIKSMDIILSCYPTVRKCFFQSFGLSALARYETSNRGNKLFYGDSKLLNKDAFIYGEVSTLELETYLIDRQVFLINAPERVLMGLPLGSLIHNFESVLNSL